MTCSFTWLPEEGFAGFRIATFATLFDNKPLPQKIGDMVTGVRFNARAIDAPMELTSEAIDLAGNVLTCKTFALEKEVFASYQLDITSSNIKALHFNIKKIEQVTTDTLSAGGFAIDDIYLMDGSTTRFTPPESDEEFLQWLKSASFNFFDWNYKDIGSDQGVVLESALADDEISLSGIGFSYAIYLIAEKDGLMEDALVKDRITRMLKW